MGEGEEGADVARAPEAVAGRNVALLKKRFKRLVPPPPPPLPPMRPVEVGPGLERSSAELIPVPADLGRRMGIPSIVATPGLAGSFVIDVEGGEVS